MIKKLGFRENLFQKSLLATTAVMCSTPMAYAAGFPGMKKVKEYAQSLTSEGIEVIFYVGLVFALIATVVFLSIISSQTGQHGAQQPMPWKRLLFCLFVMVVGFGIVPFLNSIREESGGNEAGTFTIKPPTISR